MRRCGDLRGQHAQAFLVFLQKSILDVLSLKISAPKGKLSLKTKFNLHRRFGGVDILASKVNGMFVCLYLVSIHSGKATINIFEYINDVN